MLVSARVKPGIWGALAGAIAMTSVGFWGMGWTTSGIAERVAQDRAQTAVTATLVPFCLAKAQQDSDSTRLVKFHADTSWYKRSQLVADSGWATMVGMTSPDYPLAHACASKLEPRR